MSDVAHDARSAWRRGMDSQLERPAPHVGSEALDGHRGRLAHSQAAAFISSGAAAEPRHHTECIHEPEVGWHCHASCAVRGLQGNLL